MGRTPALALAFILAFSLASPAAAAETVVAYTDKAKLEVQGDWNTWTDYIYTTKYKGNRTCNGTLTCRPGLAAGRYEIFTTFRTSVNRGSRGAKYFVDGKYAVTIKQRPENQGGKSYPKAPLGVFELTPQSKVVMKADDGTSYSFKTFVFAPTTKPVGPATGGGTSLDDLVSGGGSKPGADVSLDGPGEKTFVAPADGVVKVTAKLATYGEAALAVTVTSGGREETWMTWKRANDVDGSPLLVDGKPDAGSMFESKPGDMTAAARTHERKVKKGDRVTLTLKGDFGAGVPELSLAFAK